MNAALMPARSRAAPRGKARPVPPMPPGEQLLWQGVPAWWSVARHAYHIRPVAAYFVGLTFIDMIITRIYEGNGWPVVRAAAPTLITGGICLAILLALSWATQRTTTYTLTSRCMVMKFGVALPVTLIIPLHQIVGCAVRIRGNQGGDVSLRLVPGKEIAYVKLWPHARPWRLRSAEPMLRDLPDAAVVGPLLSRMLATRDSRKRCTRTLLSTR